MEKKIIIDITSLNDCPSEVTGIPRVVVEFSSRILKYYRDVDIIFYDYGRKNLFYADINLYLKFLSSYKQIDKKYHTNRLFKFNSSIKNALYLDLGPVESSYKRSELYVNLKKYNIKILSFIHDLIPIYLNVFEQPENCVFNFINCFSSIFTYSDYVVAVSKSEMETIKLFKNKCKSFNPLSVVPLGANFKSSYLETNINDRIKEVCKGKYLLVVGTVAPRKNHKLILNSYIKYISSFDIKLIIAGHVGWKCNDIIDFIKHNKYYNKKIFFFESPNNDEIVYLYKKAFGTIMASFAEGLGLPVIESLYYNCPIFCSDIPVFREVSKNLGVFFDNTDEFDLANKILFYLNNKEKYDNLKNDIKKFTFYTWDESFEYLNKIIKELLSNK